MAETYAIVESGGKQYRAEQGTELVVDRLPADEGSKVNLRAVMFRDDGNVVANGGDLEKVKVEATVAEHLRGKKLRVFKYKAKKGYRRRAGHRSELTRLEVTEVKLLSRKPAAKAEEKPKAKAEEKAEAKPKGEAKAESKPKQQSGAKAKSTSKAKQSSSKAKSGGKASQGKASQSKASKSKKES